MAMPTTEFDFLAAMIQLTDDTAQPFKFLIVEFGYVFVLEQLTMALMTAPSNGTVIKSRKNLVSATFDRRLSPCSKSLSCGHFTQKSHA
jgi:hypothetical protein